MTEDKNKYAIRIYDLIAEDYAKNYDSIGSDEEMIFPNTFLSYLQKGDHVVDLGCGTGFSASYFVKHGMSVEGSDLSSRMIAIAKRNYPDIPFNVADMREYIPQKEADAVWAGYSLFHFEQTELEKTLKQIKSYLKMNGIFGVVIQEGKGELERDEPFLPEEKIYLHLYTESELCELLSHNGFAVLECKRKLPLDPNEFPYNKLLAITKRIR